MVATSRCVSPPGEALASTTSPDYMLIDAQSKEEER